MTPKAQQIKHDDIVKADFNQALTMLTISWNTKTPMLLVGPPATAKTSVAKYFAEYNDFDIIVTTGATSLPTDIKGMPTAQDGQADFIPFGDLRQAVEATKDTLWILDDFTNSDKDVQKSFMQLLHERQVNDQKISDHVHIIATGNRREDKSGVSALLEAVKTRFGMVIEIVPTVDSYLSSYAIPNNIHTDVIGFLRFKPDCLYVHNPTNDMTREPNLRMWKFLSDALHELDDMQADNPTAQMVIKATCGAAIGQDVLDYRALKADLPDVDFILDNPDDCQLPDDHEIGVIFALNALLVRRATIGNLSKIIKIADRLPKVLGAKLIFDCKAALPDMISSPEYLDWAGRNRGNIVDVSI